jgi:hypothetical protein
MFKDRTCINRSYFLSWWFMDNQAWIKHQSTVCYGYWRSRNLLAWIQGNVKVVTSSIMVHLQLGCQEGMSNEKHNM